MKITMYDAISLNGKIVKNQSDPMQWTGEADKTNFRKHIYESDIVIMGRKTFDKTPEVTRQKIKAIVMTRQPENYKNLNYPTLQFTSETPEEIVLRLQKVDIKTVALIGGGEINFLFLKAGLVDELILTITPNIFGDGIDLIKKVEELDIPLKMLSVDKIDKNTLTITYQIIRTKI